MILGVVVRQLDESLVTVSIDDEAPCQWAAPIFASPGTLAASRDSEACCL